MYKLKKSKYLHSCIKKVPLVLFTFFSISYYSSLSVLPQNLNQKESAKSETISNQNCPDYWINPQTQRRECLNQNYSKPQKVKIPDSIDSVFDTYIEVLEKSNGTIIYHSQYTVEKEGNRLRFESWIFINCQEVAKVWVVRSKETFIGFGTEEVVSDTGWLSENPRYIGIAEKGSPTYWANNYVCQN